MRHFFDQPPLSPYPTKKVPILYTSPKFHPYNEMPRPSPKTQNPGSQALNLAGSKANQADLLSLVWFGLSEVEL